MSTQRLLISFTTAAVVTLGGTAAAWADPPGRVGRIGYMEGAVSLHTDDPDQWSPALLNYPVVTGNAVWTEPTSRAEIQVGSTEIRMDQQTELSFQELDDQAVRIQVPQGVVNLHLGTTPAPGEIQVVTPAGQVDLLREGTYRIDAGFPDANGGAPHVEVVVLSGEAQLDLASGPVDIQPGVGAAIGGWPVTVNLVAAGGTPFDGWAVARERAEMESQSVRYVSAETTGIEELDQSGTWTTLPDVGPVWIPTDVPPGWAPYRYGHWAFVRPWGWTWIDQARWGFAPFHYGRWMQIGPNWAWVPGARAAHPVYAPALVAFVGGDGWNVSVNPGSSVAAVGWVPLGPSEVFHPYYAVSPGYVRNVNAAHVAHFDENAPAGHYRNQQAATVIPAQAFTHAMPAHQAALAVPAQQMEHAPFTPSVAHLQPTNPAASAGAAHPTPMMHPQAAPAAAVVGHPAEPVAPARSAPAPAVFHNEPTPAAQQPVHQAPTPQAVHTPVPEIQHTEPLTAVRQAPTPQPQAVHAPVPEIQHTERQMPTPQPQVYHAPAAEIQRPVQETHHEPAPQPQVRQAEVPHPQPSHAQEKEAPHKGDGKKEEEKKE